MRITPLDVRKQEFRKAMRGLDPEEVYAFLATVADEYEAILNDNKALRERLLELDDKVQEYRTMEKTLRDTLLTAERVNVEAKDNARREASIIIKEAQLEAEKSLRGIKIEAMKLTQQVQQLRSQRDSFLARMKVVAESHLGYIESAVEDFHREDDDVDVETLVRDDHDVESLADPVVTERTAPVPPSRPSTPVAPTTPAPVSTPQPRPVTPPTSTVSSAPQTSAAPRFDTEPRATSAASPTIARTDHVRGDTLNTDGPDPITMIIDRMKRGQQEILSSGAGTPGYKEAAPQFDAVDVAEENDVTRELNLDDIRRELAAEEKAER